MLGERCTSRMRPSGARRGRPAKLSPGPVDGCHWIVRNRLQERQRRIEAAQPRAQRVVLPEERMEAVLDDLLRPIGS